MAWKDLIFSERVKAAIKEQIALMVDNEELLAELTKEKNIEEKG
ncbi:CD1375 family protein [Streptococcus mitis]